MLIQLQGVKVVKEHIESVSLPYPNNGYASFEVTMISGRVHKITFYGYDHLVKAKELYESICDKLQEICSSEDYDFPG